MPTFLAGVRSIFQIQIEAWTRENNKKKRPTLTFLYDLFFFVHFVMGTGQNCITLMLSMEFSLSKAFGIDHTTPPPPALIASSTRMVSISSAVKSRCYFTITWCGSISLTLKKFRFQFQFPFCFVFFLFHRISPLNIGNPFNLKTKCTGEEGALKNRPHFDAQLLGSIAQLCRCHRGRCTTSQKTKKMALIRIRLAQRAMHSREIRHETIEQLNVCTHNRNYSAHIATVRCETSRPVRLAYPKK